MKQALTILILLATIPAANAFIEELSVTQCSATGCSVSELNDYNNVSGMTVARGSNNAEHTDFTLFSGSTTGTINNVTGYFSHGGATGITLTWNIDFRNKTDGTVWCSVTVPHTVAFTQHTLTPTGCSWTPQRVKDLQLLYTNNDGAGPTNAYIDYINLTINYSAGPPTNSFIRYTYVNHTRADIAWNTDTDSNSTVTYGTTTSLGNTASNNTEVTSHAITLNGLDRNTFYYYNVTSCSATGCDTDGPYNFTTIHTSTVQSCSGITCNAAEVRDYNRVTGATHDQSILYYADITPLGESHPTINAVTYRYSYDAGDTTIIDFINTTDETIWCSVTAPITTGFTYNAFTPTGCGWTPQKLDELSIRHDRAGGGDTNKADFSALLIDYVLEPMIENVTNSSIEYYSAVITWNTNNTANSTVAYGNTTSLGTRVNNITYTNNHWFNLSSLTDDTQYFYNVTSCTLDVCETQGPYTFTTQLDPGPVISNVTNKSITISSATITWDTQYDANSTLSYGKTLSFGTTVINITLNKTHRFIINSLEEDTNYYYNVTSCTPTKCETQGPYTFKTTKDEGPIITNFSQNIEETNATIAWNTDTQANKTVYYGLTTSYGNTIINSTDTNNHTVSINGLAAGTPYYYRIVTCNTIGCTERTGSFITLPPATHCVARYKETGPEHTPGIISEGDIVTLECRLPGSVGEREEVTVLAQWKEHTSKILTTTSRLFTTAREVIYP